MKSPTLEQKLDAKDSTESILKRRAERSQKRRARLAQEGWSPWAVRQGYDGPIGAYEGSQDRIEMGLPKNLSERKSKRKREVKPLPSFYGRYQET